MSYTEQMLIILNAIFGKDIDRNFLKSTMLAFADGAPLEGLTEEEIAEMICKNWVEKTKSNLITTIVNYNKQIALAQAESNTIELLKSVIE